MAEDNTIIPEGDEKFYDAQGNLPSYIQDDLDRVTSEGNVPANPDDYEISGGSGNWTITWSDGTTAQTTVRNPASAANDARLLSNAFKARQTASSTSTGTSSIQIDGKPNMGQMMQIISGKTLDEIYAEGSDYSRGISSLASELLSGVVGSNQDTRDWTNCYITNVWWYYS